MEQLEQQLHEVLSLEEKDCRLYETTIGSWILSCKKEEQIPICEKALQNLFIDRFRPQVEAGKIDVSVYEASLFTLQELIADISRKVKYYQDGDNN